MAEARPALPRVPARFAPLVLPCLLSLVMTFVVSGVVTIRALGATAAALASWPSAWLLSWLIAFPTLLLALPAVRWLAARLVEPPPAPSPAGQERAA